MIKTTYAPMGPAIPADVIEHYDIVAMDDKRPISKQLEPFTTQAALAVALDLIQETIDRMTIRQQVKARKAIREIKLLEVVK